MANTVRDELLERAQQVEQLAESEKCDEAREYYAALVRDYRKLAEKVETASEETLKKLVDGI